MSEKSLLESLLITPGETLTEVLLDREIRPTKLAVMANIDIKELNNVIIGKEKISDDFALKLEYALKIPKTFWINLQKNYDFEKSKLNKNN